MLLAFTWSEFFQQITSGLAAGAIYASLALALVLIYRATDVVNFAQGEMATFTTYIAWTLMHHGLSYWPAFALTLGWAILDETYQSFFPSRTASATDVAIDGTGALLAVVVGHLGWRRVAERATVFLLWVTALGGGMFHYEYAFENIDCDRSVGSLRIPVPAGTIVTNVGFHDVDYHSGEPLAGTDWTARQKISSARLISAGVTSIGGIQRTTWC